MVEGVLSYVLQQLAFQAPVLLVYFVGFTLALVYLQRHSTASILTLLGTGILMVTTVVSIGVQAYLLQRHLDAGWPVAFYAQLLSVAGIVGSIADAIGLALVVAAVFAGRAGADSA